MDTTKTENDAKLLFRKGIECERDGKHYEATRCYKQALKLNPDVEKEIANEEIATCPTDNYEYHNSDESEDEYDFVEDLSLRFQRLIGPQICSPGYFQTATHFSVLPPELVIYIFRWVVSEDLDLRMLDQCAAVCRGWYVTARDPELWRRACSKFWPSNINELAPYNNSWRIMFIERPNVLTTGCYICKLSYVRLGEESFRDNTNGPSFNVTFYRYLRFFSNGCVLMALTSTPPAKIVRKLHTREIAPVDVKWGHYRLLGNQLFLNLSHDVCKSDQEKAKKKDFDGSHNKITFNMVLEISKYKSKHNWKLHCIDYEISTSHSFNELISTKYNISEIRSPFIFSRVKCYTNESNYIL